MACLARSVVTAGASATVVTANREAVNLGGGKTEGSGLDDLGRHLAGRKANVAKSNNNTRGLYA